MEQVRTRDSASHFAYELGFRRRAHVGQVHMNQSGVQCVYRIIVNPDKQKTFHPSIVPLMIRAPQFGHAILGFEVAFRADSDKIIGVVKKLLHFFQKIVARTNVQRLHIHGIVVVLQDAGNPPRPLLIPLRIADKEIAPLHVARPPFRRLPYYTTSFRAPQHKSTRNASGNRAAPPRLRVLFGKKPQKTLDKPEENDIITPSRHRERSLWTWPP